MPSAPHPTPNSPFQKNLGVTPGKLESMLCDLSHVQTVITQSGVGVGAWVWLVGELMRKGVSPTARGIMMGNLVILDRFGLLNPSGEMLNLQVSQ